MGALLDDINLGEDVYWQDEFNWTPVAQTVKRSLDGTLVIERISPITTGRPLTVFCDWVSWAVVKAVEEKKDAVVQEAMLLTLIDGRQFNVMFRHQDGPPMIVSPVLERPDYINQVYPDYYLLTLNLFEVPETETSTTTT